MSSKRSTPQLTRSGARRMGDEYQDIQAIEHLVSWLENIERFSWFKVEADNSGYLDDIQAMRADGTLELWQIKFSTAPNGDSDAWTWEKLLSHERSKFSLLQKWFTTWMRIKAAHSELEPGLLSNRRAAPEIADAIQNQIVRWEDIPDDTRQQIIVQLGDEKQVREFFAVFRFRVAEPGLHEIDEAAFKRFERLSGTRGGWHRLEKAMRLWVARKDELPDQCITLDEIYRVTGLRSYPIRLETFLPPSAFFENYLRPRLFHHQLPLVGRRKILAAMLNFIAEEKKIAILPGRGGNGKSRLLRKLCRRLTRSDEDLQVRIVAENIRITPNSLCELPEGRCLVIADDAHRLDGLEELLRAARQNPYLKILLVTRPHATDYLHAQGKYSGFDGREIETWLPLPNLNARETRRLARLALGREWAHYSDELAAVTRDCPLLTVIGGQLLREQKVEPTLLGQNREFRSEVLHRFHDVIIGEVTEKLDKRFPPELCARVLPLIAVTSPLHCEHKVLLQELAELAHTDTPTLVNLLDTLIAAGALLRGGNLIRIVPDVLSDYILHEACFTREGRATGWAERVFDALLDVELDAVLRNLAELDWRVRTASVSEAKDASQSIATETNLLEEVWRSIEVRFRIADLSVRVAWLKRFERFGFMQPARLWRIIEIAIHEPTEEDPDEVTPHMRRWLKPTTQETVLQQLPPILKGIACDARFTTRCIDLLWKLGRDVEVQSNSIPGALATLKDLAACKYHKPLFFNFLFLDCCRRWMNDPQIHSYRNSILAVIAPMLDRSWEYGSENKNRWQSYDLSTLPTEAMRVLRNGALTLVEQCAMSGIRPIVLQALDCLEKPISEEGLWQLDPQARKDWEEEQLIALDIVECVAQANNDPFVHIAIWDAVHQQAQNGPRIAVRTHARAILDDLPHTFEVRFILAWTRRLSWDSYAKLWTDNEDNVEEEDAKNYEAKSQRRVERGQQLCHAVVAEWVEHYSQAEDGFLALNNWVDRIETSGWWKEFWTKGNEFLLQLALDFPDYAGSLCEVALRFPHTRMAFLTYDLLFALRHQRAEYSLPYVRRFMATNESTLAHAVSESYSWRGWPSHPLSEEWALVRQLLDYPHPQVRCSAAGIVKMIAYSEPQRVLQMILETDTNGDSKLVSDLFEVFSEKLLDVAALNADQLAQLLAKLETPQNIESYHLGRFLRCAAMKNPVAVVRLLLARIYYGFQLREDCDKAHENDREDKEALYEKYEKFNPLPRNGFRSEKLQVIASHVDYANALRLIRDTSRDQKPFRLGEDAISSLYRDFSLGYNPISLDVLNEWINSNESEFIQGAIRLLGNTSMNFYFHHIEFVAHCLESANRCGPAVLENVKYQMQNFAVYGPPGAMASHRGERSNALFRGAQEAIEKMKADTSIQSPLAICFYQELKESAQEWIHREKEQDEAEEVFRRSC